MSKRSNFLSLFMSVVFDAVYQDVLKDRSLGVGIEPCHGKDLPHFGNVNSVMVCNGF